MCVSHTRRGIQNYVLNFSRHYSLRSQCVSTPCLQLPGLFVREFIYFYEALPQLSDVDGWCNEALQSYEFSIQPQYLFAVIMKVSCWRKKKKVHLHIDCIVNRPVSRPLILKLMPQLAAVCTGFILCKVRKVHLYICCVTSCILDLVKGILFELRDYFDCSLLLQMIELCDCWW